MVTNRFTSIVGCTLPLQLAAMPGVVTPLLAAAVCNAGGLGMISGVRQTPETLPALMASVRELTGGPFGINFLMPFLASECVDVAASQAAVVEFFYADPERSLVELVNERGALASWQIGSVD